MNAMIPRRLVIPGALILCLMMGPAASSQNAQEHRRVINVRTVNQLYAAVNDSANRNVTVRLAPGTYLLSSFKNNGAPRRNQGALRMPPGMSLVGSEKRVDINGDGVPDPVSDETPDDFAVPGTETIIDGSALVLPGEATSDCAGETFAIPNPTIHIGVNNVISHLTVYAGGNVAIGEPSNNPVDPNGMSIKVTNTVLHSTFFGLSFENMGCAARGARSFLTFSHNVVRGSGFHGVMIMNFMTGDSSNDRSNGPATWATLKSNLFYNNGRALRVAGGDRSTDGGSVTLFMRGNVFRNNRENFLGVAATARVLTPVVGNRLKVRSEFDTFGEALVNVKLIAGQGGLDNDPQGSMLEAEFIHSRFIRDFPETPAEISIFGGAGTRNRAEVLIRHATVRMSEGGRVQGGLLIQDQELPGIGTGTARLEGSRREFIQMNQGLPAPPAHFFLEH